METTPDGGGRFTSVTLRPLVTIASPEMEDAALDAHREASQKCFIANSVSFPVLHEPRVVIG
jgi:organic hydroperoxide reductase OsmC/OhrA